MKTRILLHLLCYLLVTEFAVATDRASPVTTILMQMSDAHRTLNYSGTFIYHHHGRMDTMRIIHKADQGKIQEKIVALTGPSREVIDNNTHVMRISSDNKSITIEKSNSANLPLWQLSKATSKLSKYYQCSIAGQERIANRTALIVDIMPKDQYRYGYQLWIELDTKLLLKSELKNAHGEILEQFFFTELEIMEQIPDQLLEPSTSTAGYIVDDQSSVDIKLQDTDNDSAWIATWVPDGFLMSEYGKHPAEHFVYSDGLTLFSVFMEKFDQPKNIVTGAFSLGGLNVFAIIKHDHLITVMGEVPKSTVEMIANSVQPR